MARGSAGLIFSVSDGGASCPYFRRAPIVCEELEKKKKRLDFFFLSFFTPSLKYL